MNSIQDRKTNSFVGFGGNLRLNNYASRSTDLLMPFDKCFTVFFITYFLYELNFFEGKEILHFNYLGCSAYLSEYVYVNICKLQRGSEIK